MFMLTAELIIYLTYVHANLQMKAVVVKELKQQRLSMVVQCQVEVSR